MENLLKGTQIESLVSNSISYEIVEDLEKCYHLMKSSKTWFESLYSEKILVIAREAVRSYGVFL